MRTLIVEGRKTFKITIPEDAQVTFGPWSPPQKGQQWSTGDKEGTLRVYSKDKKVVLGVFSGITGVRDSSIGYMEQVAKEEGAVLWKSDKDGYVKEEKVVRKEHWTGEQKALPRTKKLKV